MKCTCGEPTRRYKTRPGFAKYCSKSCQYKAHSAKVSGPNHGGWKGGVIIRYGYRLVRSPNHPYVNAFGYVREHRLVMEKRLGRYLKPSEVVHHIDENRINNHPNNLQLMGKGQHSIHHHLGKTHSKETIEKIRHSNIGKNKGKKWSPATREKMKKRVPWNKGLHISMD